VVSERDRNHEELPLDFGMIARLGMPVPLINGIQDVVTPFPARGKQYLEARGITR
jgi:2-hydroxymuconate-semialdehyde hydrolase